MIGISMLIFAVGCGSASQASTTQKDSQTSESTMAAQDLSTAYGNPIASFDWQQFSHNHSQDKLQDESKIAPSKKREIVPSEIVIPAINVSAKVISTGKSKDG
ncbi:MAG TPA: hypothetical protein VFK44_08900 [Bacillales bacterium]|nr:hypothetical protein [Bacillales bacterium]